jgi:thiamine-monophosphate kinase
MHHNNSGEFEIINRFLRKFTHFPADLIVPPGDDCAVIRISDHYNLLVTTDMLVEDIHFMRDACILRHLGHKAIAVNLSDIAAMGGIPAHAFISLAVPKSIANSFFEDFSDGVSDMCHRYNVSLSGGDMTGSTDKIVINVCIIGMTDGGRYLKRSGAKVGDCIQISGPLGGSAAGLDLFSRKKDVNRFPSLVKAHCAPEPRIHVGQALNTIPEIHAMIDISDGLLQDLGHICRQSQTGAVVYSEDVSLFEEALKATNDNEDLVVKWALTGGEDYELIWTVDPSAENAAIEAALSAGAPLPKTIGKIVSGNQLTVLKNNQIWNPSVKGWDHFRN